MRFENLIHKLLFPLCGLALQVAIALLVYSKAQRLIGFCMRKAEAERLPRIYKSILGLLPLALAACIAHGIMIAAEEHLIGAWMVYGTAAFWIVLVYSAGAKLLKLLMPPEAARSYEFVFWLPIMALLAVVHFSGALPRVSHVISQPLLHLGGKDISALSLLTAFAIALISLRLSWMAAHRLHALSLSRYGFDEHAAYIISQAVRVGMLIVGGLIAIDVLGIDLSSLKFFAGAFGLGLGFGMQQIANNLVSGALLLAEQSVRVGDVISVAGQVGKVERITARAIFVRTYDDRQVILPNMQLLTAPVIRWAKGSPSCLQLTVGTAHVDDLNRLRELLHGVISEHPKVISDPPIRVRLTKLSGDSLSFEVLVWVDALGKEALQIEGELYECIYKALKGAGIGIK